MNADKAGKLVEGRLEKFGLNMPRHIVGAETVNNQESQKNCQDISPESSQE